MSNLKNPAADDAAVDIEGGLGITYRPFQCASGKYGLLTVLVALLLVTGVRADADPSVPDDPYASYLLWPHFHFSGTFCADVSTVNNNVSNYNINKTRVDPYPPWQNPRGSGEWSVIGSVTQMYYADGTCLGQDDVHINDSLKAAPVNDGGTKTFAKMVDLDPEGPAVSEIWGWKIRIGNLFSADFTPVPLKYLWTKMNGEDLKPDFRSAAVYQSVLSNISWIDKGDDSPFIKHLQKAMENKNIDSNKLSIRINVDMFQPDKEKDSYKTGRVTGTIGLLGLKSPSFFTHGRMMNSLVRYLQDTPFYVDEAHKRVFIDFGNSLPTNENGGFDTSLINGSLFVAIAFSKSTEDSLLTCSDDLQPLGEVYFKSPNWYNNSAGVVVVPVLGPSLSEEMMEKLRNQPVVVVEASGTMPYPKCSKILLQEASDGIDIHPYRNKWTFRKNPGEKAEVSLFATKFGKPLPNTKVKIEPCNCFGGKPEIGQPPLPVPADQSTNQDGIATLFVETIDPKNNRGFIDGQIYVFMYSVESQNKTCNNTCNAEQKRMLLNSLVVILVWDNYTLNGRKPRWLDDIYPIFKQYAILYPVMTENFVDLGNYYDVKNHKKAIMYTLSLPVEHPNHMPVTRDLSKSKRDVILQWLSDEELPIGEPKNFYTLENLRKDLQTALALEHATIPPYLTALASIKYSYNLEIQAFMKTIIVQEMMHMALVANILNAVGGEPSLYSKDFIPQYPSRLPGGVQPDLIVPIQKLSLDLIRNIFMKIEQPEEELDRWSYFQDMFSLIGKKQKKEGAPTGHCEKNEEEQNCEPEVRMMVQATTVDPGVDEDLNSTCFKLFNRFLEDFKQNQLRNIREMAEPISDLPVEKQEKHGKLPGENLRFTKHHNTIGGFYIHILNALAYLTNCGKNNSIFSTGNESRQVNFGDWSVYGETIMVTDFKSAVKAIEAIIEQGEGSDPCNPEQWVSRNKELSHYFLFYSVAEEHEIKVYERNKTKPEKDSDDPKVADHPQFCNATYYFIGPKIPFASEGIWPMVTNPDMSKYRPGSQAYRQAVRFNQAYTKLLESLEKVFNGYPHTLGDALGLMYSVDLHLTNLVRTPIDNNGDPQVGPNAGPTFDFTP